MKTRIIAALLLGFFLISMTGCGDLFHAPDSKKVSKKESKFFKAPSPKDASSGKKELVDNHGFFEKPESKHYNKLNFWWKLAGLVFLIVIIGAFVQFAIEKMQKKKKTGVDLAGYLFGPFLYVLGGVVAIYIIINGTKWGFIILANVFVWVVEILKAIFI